MFDTVLLVPLLFVSFIFSSLFILFAFRRLFEDKTLKLFALLLLTIWLYSVYSLLGYFGLLPGVVEAYSPSITLFILHMILMFQVLFIKKYLFLDKKINLERLFVFLYLFWSAYYSLPDNVALVVLGGNQSLQIIYSVVSLLPALVLFVLTTYLLVTKNSFSKWRLSMMLAGLVLPVAAVYFVIWLQANSSQFSLGTVFLALSSSMFFFAALLYRDPNRKYIFSYKEEMMLVLSALLFIPMAVRTMYMYSNVSEVLIQDTLETMKYERFIEISKIQDTFKNYKTDLLILSKKQELRNYSDLENREKITEYFSEFVRLNSTVSQLRILNLTGQEIVRVDQGLGTPIVIPEAELQFKGERDYFADAEFIEFEEVFVSEISLNREGPENQLEYPYNPQARFITPLFTGAERTGYLVMNISMADLFQQFVTPEIPFTQYIVDKNGNFVYHPDPQKRWGSEQDLNTGTSLQTELQEIADLVFEGESDSVIVGQNSQKQIYSYIPIQITEDTAEPELYLIYESDVEVQFAKINWLTESLIFSVLLLMTLISIVVYLFVEHLIRPIQALKSAIDNYSLVDISNFDLKSSEEIESVVQSFSRMMGKFNQSQKEVNVARKNAEQIADSAQRLEKQRVAMINLIEDIDSERKLTQQQASDLRKFKLAVDNVSEMIVITDPEGKVIYVNPAVEPITGYSQDEVIGSKAGKLWGGLMPEEWYKNFWLTISERKQKFTGNITNKRKNGDKFIAEIAVQPLLDDIGNVQYYVSVQRDVTKEMQIDRMKTDFISLASHQLRTPLSAMRWFLEMLLDGDMGELNREQRDAVVNVNDSNQRMISLVNSLLNISRIESGRIMVSPKPTDLSKLIQDTIKTVNERFNKKSQEIKYTVEANLPPIMLDQDLIMQVVLNLLTNANTYTPEGGKIHVSLSQMDEFALVKVSDSGMGIPEKEQQEIFKRFYRAANVVKKGIAGTGLGLYLAKTIVDSSGGKIWFKSEEGKGTTFWFTVPLAGVKKKEGEVALTVSA